MLTRFPSAMFASVRCRPHCAFGTGCRSGAPSLPVIWSTLAPLADEQWPVYAPSASIQRVEASTTGSPTRRVAAPIDVFGANGLLGYTVRRSDEPPLSAAGLVHSTSRPGTVVRPNTESSGIGAL